MNDHESNPYLKRQDQLQEARNRWRESEWLLSFLRSDGCDEPKTLTEEELLIWAKNIH